MKRILATFLILFGAIVAPPAHAQIANPPPAVTSVGMTAPAAGFSITSNTTNPITRTGTFTFALTNDLAALEALSSTGIAVRSTTDTWVQRSIAAGANISVTNGSGVSGNPTIALANVVNIGTSITTPNDGLFITDVGGSHFLELSTSSTYSHDTKLSINTVPNASGMGTIYDWTLTIENNIALDQNLLTTSTVRFGAGTSTGKWIMGAFSLGGAEQVINITANTNDLAISDSASIVYLIPDDNWTITGLNSPDNQVWYELHNASSTKSITLSHENASSSVFGRFHFASGADLVLPPLSSTLIYYPDSKWRLVVDSVASGTVTSVGLTVPSGLSVSGSPVTTTGTLAVTTALNGVILGDGSGFSAVAIPSDATKFLNGAASPAFALVKDSDLSLSDITTNNSSTSKHGFLKKLDNDSSHFMDGTGAWTVPTGSGVVFANPSGLIGMSAVNGASTSATRADATHAIDPAINPTWTGTHKYVNGIGLQDTANNNTLSLIVNNNMSANQTIAINCDAADHVIFVQNGDVTLDDWFNQSVKTTASPTHVGLTLSGLTASKGVFTDGSKALTTTGTLSSGQGGTNFANGYSAGDMLIGKSDGTLTRGAIIAGANMTVTLGDGTVTLSSSGGGGGGSFTGPISVVSANGLAGSVANATTVGTITLSTTINSPLLAGNGTAISAATTTGSGSTAVLNNNPTITGSLTLSGSSPTFSMHDAGTHSLNFSVTSSMGANHSFTYDINNDVNLSLGGDFSTTGDLDIASVSQGDMPYGSSTGVLSMLAKNATATRYVSNQGTSNNPSWSQVNLTNGVTGTLPFGNGGTSHSSYTDGQILVGNSVSGGLDATTITAGVGIGISNGHGTITISNTGTGTGGSGLTSVGIIVPAQGLTILNSPLTANGDMTLGLSNDLAAVEALSSSGMVARTGTDAWTTRTLASANNNRLTVNNGDGISGAPTFNVPDSAQLNVAKLVNLTSNGFVKTGSSDGTLSVDTNTYLTTAVTSIATSNGITGGTITSTGTISGINAAADGSTKGVSKYTANDFNDDGNGLISLDYTNGQAASGSLKGYLTSTDWTTFNNKVPTTRTISTTSPLAGGGDLSANRTLSITGAAGQVLAGSGPAFTATPTLGVAGTTQGQLLIAGSTSGTVTIQTAAAAGTHTIKLPTSDGTAGQLLKTDGSGQWGWVTSGGGGGGMTGTGTDNRIAVWDGTGVSAIKDSSLTISGSQIYSTTNSSEYIDFSNTTLHTDSHISIDWHDGSLVNGSTGAVTANYFSSQLQISGSPVVDWGAEKLESSAGVDKLYWDISGAAINVQGAIKFGGVSGAGSNTTLDTTNHTSGLGSPSNGVANANPGTPTHYLQVKINGTDYAIPLIAD